MFLFAEMMLFRYLKPIKLIKMMEPISAGLHTYKLTPNINLCSTDIIQNNELNQNKPHVILMSWMLGKIKHLSHYTNLYIDRGCDVITVNITPWQLIWPTRGSQVVAKELVQIIEKAQMPLLVHGFSVGAYVWGEALLMLGPDHPIYSKIQGQVWDSAADFATIAHGLSFAVFPENVLARNALKCYINFHKTLFHYFSVIYYQRARDIFFQGRLAAPALLYWSENDLIGSADANRELRDDFTKAGIDVTCKSWDKSEHVKHLNYHTEEYLDELNRFLIKVAFPPAPKAKL